ncbi:hypothetical protein FSARC_7806 [Fusarium sarcochroum]|uniref:Major facilitator superfamily (MFS) profile domain-containing protein n=1 Tax=Fusarium sarcochroum TaxID=1208366 RepID=A0A8H4TUG4_9HYPO|nr:hypothetical protein FSARC_7806 [Fusarium sarcochroum]
MDVDQKQAKPDVAKATGTELAAVLPDDGTPWYKRKNLVKVNICVISLMLFSGSNGFDGSLMNGLLALPHWNEFMDYPTGAWLGFINAIYSLGCATGYPVAAYISNRWGRKLPVWASVFCAAIGVALQTAAQNDVMFIIARLFQGWSQGFTLSVPLLIAENAYPTHRGVCSALVLLPIIGLPGLIMMPESPRWLVFMDRADEARKNLADLHTGGDVNSPLIEFEMAEIEMALKAEIEAKKNSSWNDLWATPGNRHRLFITISLGTFAQWSGNGVVSYYLAIILNSVGITSVTDQTLISACLQIWNVIWAVLAALNVDRLGRRMLFMTSAIVMLVSYIIIITGLSGSFAATGDSATGLAVIPFLFIYFFGYDIALTPLVVSYPIEIWPYNLRARGLAMTQMVSLGFTFFNTFVNPIALEAVQWKYYFVFLAILIAMVVCVWFGYPETRGLTLENVAWIFDGD